MWLKDKTNEIYDSLKIGNAFKNDKRSILIQVIKGDRKKLHAIFDKEKCCFYLLKEKEPISESDLIVNFRNQLFKVLDVQNHATITIDVDNRKQEIAVVAVSCENYKIDNSLFEMVNNQKQTSYQVLNINIDSISNSSVQSIGNQEAINNARQDIVTKWCEIKREIEWRFDYKEHKKYIDSVDSAISNNDSSLVDMKAKERTVKLLGSFLGELIAVFTANLIKYFNKG